VRVLVDIGHPGHVHLFRHPVRLWRERGHGVVITIRERDIVGDLLRAYGLDYHVASRARTGRLGQALELLIHDWAVWHVARRERCDILLGTSVAAAHASRLMRAKSVIFEEDDEDVIGLFARLTYPFAHRIVIPDCLRDRRTGKHVTYPGYHELAYLHPDHFAPDRSVLDELGVAPGEPFFIIRHVALKAFHDVGEHGLSEAMLRELVGMLSDRGKVFLTLEGDVPEFFRPFQIRIPPHRIHDAMSFATLLVSDSQTMTAEAAVLGVPSIRCNSFVGRLSYLEELEHRYGLTRGVRPERAAEVRAVATDWLGMRGLRSEWQRRRQRMLSEKINVANWIADTVEGFAGHSRNAVSSSSSPPSSSGGSAG
jgi:predicted glycosyltransferase